MSRPVHDVLYWRQRLQAAKVRHHAIFLCDTAKWERIEAVHRQILAKCVGKFDSVLDVGCGYGRLLTLMYRNWCGDYLGVDLSPDFVELARAEHPDRKFIVHDMMQPTSFNEPLDWAVLISIRPMIRREMGDEAWLTMESNVRQQAKRMLFLEYDPLDPGEIVCVQ